MATANSSFDFEPYRAPPAPWTTGGSARLCSELSMAAQMARMQMIIFSLACGVGHRVTVGDSRLMRRGRITRPPFAFQPAGDWPPAPPRLVSSSCLVFAKEKSPRGGVWGGAQSNVPVKCAPINRSRRQSAIPASPSRSFHSVRLLDCSLNGLLPPRGKGGRGLSISFRLFLTPPQ